MAFHALVEELRIGFGDISYGVNSHGVKLLFASSSDHKELAHRKRPHFFRNFFRKKGVDAVGFLKV